MSNSIFDATILGGGNKAISLSVLKSYYTGNDTTRNLIGNLTNNQIFSLSKNKVYISPTISDTTTIEFNTLFIDQKNINCKYKAEDQGTYIIIPDKNLKDNSGTNSITISDYFLSDKGKIIIMDDDEKRNELLNEMLFDATSIRGGTRAVSITHPKLLAYLNLKGENTIKIGETEDINTLIIDGYPKDNLNNYSVVIDKLAYLVIDTQATIKINNNTMVKSISFPDPSTKNYGYLVYNKRTPIIEGIINSESAYLIINESIMFSGNNTYKFNNVFNYGLMIQYADFEVKDIFNNGLWRCHANLTATSFGNRNKAVFYHDISKIKNGKYERTKVEFHVSMSANENGIYNFDGDIDLVLNVEKEENLGGFFENSGGYYHFGNDVRLFINSKYNEIIISNYGTIYFNCELITNVQTTIINYDEGVLYLEKDFNTQDINKFMVKNDSVVINNSIHIKSIDLFDKLDFSDENKHGMLLDVVNSKYYTKDNKSGKDIYSNPGNYSECVKYLYSSNVNTKDLQVLSLLNDYNTLRTIKDDNDLYKIKFLLFLICDALRIPRKYI